MQFISLDGVISYKEALEVQHKLIRLRSEKKIEDTIIFLEHDHVMTSGRGLQRGIASKPASKLDLPDWITFEEAERGGGLTYHGPGQLIVYPIVDVHSYGVAKFIRVLEEIVIWVLRKYGMKARTKTGATGVWIGDKKIASIGIAVKKWISFHGIALNVINDLEPFKLISPCGFDPSVMTRMMDIKKVGESWRNELEELFAQAFRSEF